MVDITPVQRAICRAMTGEPIGELSSDANVIAIFGGQQACAELPRRAPDMVVLGAAIRCGKSTIVAAKALRNAYLGDCSDLAYGEVPRVAILSVDLDKSRETLSKITGAMLNSTRLRQLLVTPRGMESPITKDSVFVRNRSGRTVEIKVVAGARSGQTLISKWLLGLIADEAPRLQGQEDGVINLDDALSAVVARMRPGAQIDLVGSLWAPRGKVFELITHRFGKPGPDLVVMVANGPQLRPELYTPEYCERIRKADDRAYEADVMSHFADPETVLIPSVEITAATRADEGLRATPYMAYIAVIDPATRGNGWTLIVIGAKPQGGYELVLAREWIGSRAAPLKGSQVLPEIGAALEPYGIDAVHTDQAGYDHLVDIAELVHVSFELRLVTRDDDVACKRLPALFTERRLTLPDVKQLRADLIALKRRPKQGGGSAPVLPKTADGRHCDYGAAVLLAMQVLPEHAEAPLPGLDEETLFCLKMQEQINQGPMHAAGMRLMGAA